MPLTTRSIFGKAAVLTAFSMVTALAEEPGDRFYQAIRRDDSTALLALMKSGDVNEKDRRGSTPLFYAAAYGSLNAMRILVAKGAQVNTANAFGATPLMLAISEPEKVRFLIAKGAGVNAHSKVGRTPLLLAAATSGASATVKLLLDRGANPAVRDSRQWTPLLAASAADDLATMRLLLEKGAGVNEKDASGTTPLMNAASNGNLKATQLLLARGADVNAVSGANVNPPVKNGPIAIGALTPLLLAAAYGGPDVVKALLDAGANVNAQDVRGMTALMTAIASDHADPRIVQLLIKGGADLNKQDLESQTAAGWAAKFNSVPVSRELGIQIDRQDGKALVIPANERPTPELREAVSKSVALLERNSEGFFKEGGCVACHAQNLTGMATSAARASHIPVNEKAQSEQLKSARLQFVSFEQPLLQRMDPPVPDILTYVLLQFAAEDAPADRATDAMVHNLAAQQMQAGNWHVGSISRAPMGDGDFSRTATAIRALQVYAPPGRKADFQRRIEHAAAWLQAATPKTTEDLDMQLLGLKWAGAGRPAWQDGIRQLLSQQREDGGWAQTSDLASDAYATGQALYTLHELGVPASDASYRRGVDHLLRTQEPDGSWHVHSRATKIQPYFESGFPYGPDQWISSAATAWAAMGLSYGTEAETVASLQR